MPRIELTKLVIIVDLVVCLIFIILIYSMRVCTIKETKNMQTKSFLMTDFTVELTNLPEQ
jgi:hypothetical protein